MGKLQDLKEEAEEEEKDIAGKNIPLFIYLFTLCFTAWECVLTDFSLPTKLY